MTEIINPLRAKSAYVEVERADRYGKRKPRKVKQHIVVNGGTMSGKEMEHTAIEMAKELGVDESKVKIETYAKGEAPVEVNPYHRGMAKNWNKQVSEPTEVIAKKEIRVRRVFNGWSFPKTEEEMAEYLEEFYAHQAAVAATRSPYRG